MTAIIEQTGDDFERSGTASSFRRRRELSGLALVVLSTVAIAIVPSFAKLAYDGGSNTLTVITARSIVSVALTWLAMGRASPSMAAMSLAFPSAWQVGSATKITAQRNEKQPCEFQERPSLEWRRR